MATAGQLKSFDWHRGVGFINPDDGSEEVYLSLDAVERAGIKALRNGEQLSYDTVRNGNKLSAVNVRLR
jgi:CspA family cold shock protein